jgi:hypothetical protein
MSHEELVRVRQPDPSMEEIKDAAMKSTSKGNPSLGSVVDIINSKWMMDNRQPTNVPAVERVFDANKPPKLTWKQIVSQVFFYSNVYNETLLSHSSPMT